MELCSSFRALFEPFSASFSGPCFSLWTTLMTGWVLSHRHRYITDLIVSSDATRDGAWCNFHRFFNRYKWSLDEVCRVSARLVVDSLVPREAVITLAVDDTLCRKRGLGLFGAGMHHDALLSSRGLKLFSWGHDWVVVCIVVSGLPWAPPIAFALPVGFRLYVNKQGLTKGKKKRRAKKGSRKRKTIPAPAGHRTRPELAVELLTLVAEWFPERMFVVTGDSLYGGKSVVQHLPDNMDLISRATIKAALYAPAVRRAGVGRPRKKGVRLPTIDAWADDLRAPWTTLKIDQYGLHATLRWKRQDALFYGVGKNRLMSLIVVEDVDGKRGRQVFFATNPNWSLLFILRTYALRWSIEVTFENLKQHLGFSDAANWKEQAVRRTAPMAGVIYSLTVVWFHQTGHQHVQFPHRPWYRQKKWPSFADMLTTLRRQSFEEKLIPHKNSGVSPKHDIKQLTYFLSLAG
jgi:hypothetical protein